MRIFLRLLDEAASLFILVFKPMNLGVKLILLKDDQVLLVKHKYGCDWYLPGGGIKRTESVEAAARREAQEEVGATLGELRSFGIYSRPNTNKHVAVLVCNDFTLTGETDFEIDAFDFFPINNLPEDASGSTKRRIAEFLAPETGTGLGRW